MRSGSRSISVTSSRVPATTPRISSPTASPPAGLLWPWQIVMLARANATQLWATTLLSATRPLKQMSLENGTQSTRKRDVSCFQLLYTMLLAISTSIPYAYRDISQCSRNDGYDREVEGPDCFACYMYGQRAIVQHHPSCSMSRFLVASASSGDAAKRGAFQYKLHTRNCSS